MTHPYRRTCLSSGSRPGTPARGKFRKLHISSFIALAFLGIFLLAVPGMAIPATTHDVTFVNNASQTLWINVQGGVKGVCTGVIDDNTHREKTCTACSPCPKATGASEALLCNVSESTGSLTPLCCPGVKADKNYCWDGTACTTGCCSTTGESATGGLLYNCPGSGMYSGCPYDASSAANKAIVDGLSGYNNSTTGLHRIVCSGTLLGGGNITLNAGDKKTFPLQYGWQGAFYPRTNCSFDPVTGIGDCETGKCIDNLGNSVIGCGGSGSENPVTKGELNLDDNGDWFDVSYVNGFNVGMTIEPGNVNAGSDNCYPAGCAISLSDIKSPAVPDFSALKFMKNGKFVGIWADCDLSTKNGDDAAIKDGYCCPYPPYINSTLDTCGTGPGTCKICAGQDSSLYPFNQPGALPNSAKLFFDSCPGKVYTYAYNDSLPNRQCHNATDKISNYTITFYASNLLPSQTPVPSATLETGSNSGAVSSSDSSSVGSVSASNSAGTTSVTFDQVPAGTSQVGVSQVQITTSGPTESYAVTAQQVSLGEAMQIQGQPVAGYLQISPVGVPRSSIASGTITFVVSGSWLTANNIAPASVILERYSNNQWNALPTTFLSQSGNNFYFSAVTPGFSYFAITVKSPGSTGAETTTAAAAQGTFVPVAAAITGTTGVPGISSTEPVTVTPVATKTLAPATAGGFSMVTLSIAVAALVIIVIAGFLIRRWWIRRQNPSLFKRLD